MFRFLSLTAAAALVSTSAQAITVSASTDADALASAILGSGVTISTSSLTGADGSAGTFTGGLGSIGIENGIILSSGLAVDAIGPNDQDGAGLDVNAPGDSDLDNLIPQTTYDAARLDITFTTNSGDVFFQYAFASEEYNEYTNSSYNDVFALFLDGDNIALIPGTNLPVAINNVNGGNPLGTDASYPEYYNNNDLDDGGPFFDIQYDGFTDVFTAQGLGLSPGAHTLSFVIADAGDSVLDSAIFIAGGSLTDVPIPDDDGPNVVPLPASLPLLLVGLAGFGVLRRRSD